jgi:NAD-dependent deacetylase
MEKLTACLREAERILVFTGAGISTGSGIPDFRGPQGIWKTQQPVDYRDFMTSPAARVRYWRQKLDGWQSFRDARPNAAHAAVADLERAGKVELVVTQNIDGLHRAAGTSRLVEIHGTNGAVECQRCGERSAPEPHFEAFGATGEAPACACGGWLKPATISFGQSLRQEDLARASEAAARCDLVLALGSTLSVYPAAELPLAAARRGVPYFIINRGPTEHDDLPLVTGRLEGDVVDLLPRAVAAVCSAP